jgi:acyl-coenzyme A synthetase/AMP-(fatty) acid ligase
MMNAGGVRVSPIELENVLNAHPAIVKSAAVEVRVKPDTTVIAAFYVSSASVETTELERFVAGRLARYKCPRIYTRVETIPKGANNKPLRQVLRKSYEESPGEARTSRDG